MVESIKELRKICQKPLKEYNLLREGIWRIPSIYITKLMLYTSVMPNQVTFFMIFCGFFATFFFSLGNYWSFVVGALVLEFVYVLDGVDGEIARYRKISSSTGVFLDLVSHISNTAIPFIGLTIGLYKINLGLKVAVFGLLASTFAVCNFDVQLLKHHVIFKELIKYAKGEKSYKKISAKRIKPEEKLKENFFKQFFKRLIIPFYDVFLITQIIMFAAIFDKLYWVLVFYGLTFPIVWFIKFLYEYKIGTVDYDFLFKPYKK